MSPSVPTPVRGRSKLEQAIHVAGMLAEAGILELLLTHDTNTTRHPARTTDLPRLLATAPAGAELRTADDGLVIEISDHALLVRCAPEPLHARLTGGHPEREPNR